MAKKPDITTIASGYYSRQALNTNFENLQTGFDNTLSLDGSTPNAMGADLDMNSNDILNAGTVNTSILKLDGTVVSASGLSAAGATLASDSHTGNGSTTAFSMSYEPFIKDNTQVYIDGVYQEKSTYSISGTTLTFSEAPPLNAGIEIVVTRTLDFGADDAANINYTQGGTGSVNRTVLTKLQEFVSVKDFGAVGDGVMDDTAAIQAAITYATANDKALIFPYGTYKHTSTLVFTCSAEGIGAPKLMSVGDIVSVQVKKYYGYFKNFLIYPDGTGSSNNDGLKLAGIARTHIENVTVRSCGNDGIVIDSSGGSSESSNLGILTNVQSFSNGRHGIFIGGSGIDQNAMVFNNIDVRSNGSDGLHIGALFSGSFFNGVTAQNNTNYGIYFNDPDCRNIIGTVYIESNTAGDMVFSADAHSNFITLSNDGGGFTDNNGTNTVLYAGSGGTQRYRFNTIDMIQSRIYNWSDVGQLTFTHTGDRAYQIAHTGSGASGTLTFSKGSASAINIISEGAISATGQIYPQSGGAFSGPAIYQGSGSPEGSVTAAVGSTYMRSDGGAGTSFYVKESGTGNTGWVAK